MIRDEYESRLAPFIVNFVEQKRALGYPYDTSSRILLHFDRLAATQFPDDDTITKALCDAWLAAKPGEHPNGLLRRITPVRQLSKYMRGLGIDTYIIPNNIPKRMPKYDAHIYTSEELIAFFASVDRCAKSVFAPLRHYVIPVFFRVLYCCGLRSSEARFLKTEDVDLETGKIVIRESKGWQRRIVYMSDDLRNLCQEYDAAIADLMPDRQVFFPNAKGAYYNKCTVSIWFHEFWDDLPVARNITGNAPRVHDFRHSYAVHRLNGWVRNGQDVNALYPYLSEYMGHRNYPDTDYYLSLIEDFYPELEDRLSCINEEILPEVRYGQ